MSSARSFLRGIIDYAGLFPPAQLGMSAAVNAYDEYRHGADKDLLGRFVVPATRLGELSNSLAQLPHEGASNWKLSVIASDVGGAARAVEQFNSSHSNGTACDSVEMPVKSVDDINNAVDLFAANIELFLELDLLDDPLPLIREIATTRASAKIRTGGVVESAIPSPSHVLRFMEGCVDEGVPFKATAGLHHLIRGRYPLTYDEGSATAVMFGFMNVFLAAALCASGSSEGAVLGALEETDPTAFRFDDRGFWWQDHFLLHEQLAVVRQNVAVSFGSCSFTEPVSQAKLLHLI
jgi:hypothetical protein